MIDISVSEKNYFRTNRIFAIFILHLDNISFLDYIKFGIGKYR